MLSFGLFTVLGIVSLLWEVSYSFDPFLDLILLSAPFFVCAHRGARTSNHLLFILQLLLFKSFSFVIRLQVLHTWSFWSFISFFNDIVLSPPDCCSSPAHDASMQLLISTIIGEIFFMLLCFIQFRHLN